MAIAPDTVDFSVGNLGGLTAEDNPEVGTKYQVAINGVGYMLVDDPDRGIEWDRQTVPLDPQRLATGETPLTEAIDRYMFHSQIDWSAGAGRFWRRRGRNPDPATYWDSYGIDPFSEPGKLKLLKATTEELQSTYEALRAVVVGDTLYVQTDDDELQHSNTPDGAFTTLGSLTDGSGPVTITDLTSDGQYWYAATGQSIIRGTTSNPNADWSAEDAVSVKWIAGRICAAVKGPNSTTPNRFTTLNDQGGEEREDGHLTLDAGHTIVLGGTAAGHVYFGSYAGDRGSIWAWELGLDDAGNQFFPFVAWELPEGEIPVSVGTAGGAVWIKSYRPSGSDAGRTVLYQGLPSEDGTLTIVEVGTLVEQGGEGDHSAGGDITGAGDLVLFPWPDMTEEVSGIGAVYLPTGGYAKWLVADGTGDVSSIVLWQGRPVFCVRGQGVFREVDTYMAEGWVQSSVEDARSSLQKEWDLITVEAEPLPANTAVEVAWSADQTGTYNHAGTLTGAGQNRAEVNIDLVSASLSVQTKLATQDDTVTPVVLIVETRYFALGLVDTVLTLPIDCADTIRSITGAVLPESGAGMGLRRAKELQALTQTRVRVQDIDWHITGQSEVMKVEAVRLRAFGAYDANQGHQRYRTVAIVTLRKAGL